MDIRDNAVTDIIERIYNEVTNNPPYDQFELCHMELTPVDPIGVNSMPAILLFEDEDSIIKRATHNNLGFPLIRTLSLMIEVWDLDKDRVKKLYKSTRKGALSNGGLLTKANVVEKKTVGPYSSGRDGTMGIRLVLEIVYTETEL